MLANIPSLRNAFAVMMSTLALCISTVAGAGTVDRQSVTIWSQGVRLAGDIYTPSNIAEGERLPGVLMIAGWGGNKNNVGRNYAEAVAAEGYVVLAFDFKGWGESDGAIVPTEALGHPDESVVMDISANHVRQIVDPFSMAADVRAALFYLGGEATVMPNNLGVWGTSMGGGMALIPAATDSRVKAYVSQMGPINYAYNLSALPAAGMQQIETLTARGLLPPYPGPMSRQMNPALAGFPDWAALKRFDLLSYMNQLAVPTLIIDAESETLFDTEQNGVLMYHAVKEKASAEYMTLPGGHYDMYHGDNLDAGRAAAIAWFNTHLKAD